MRKLIYIFVIFSWMLQIIHSDQDIKFRVLSVKEGLSDNTVRAVIQDKQGYIWFGTDDGLNRYDGYSFRVFRNILGEKSELKKYPIIRIHEDDAGLLWIGTNGMGVHVFNPLTEKFIMTITSSPSTDGLSNNTITGIVQDESGYFWIGTYGGGLNRYDPSSKTFLYFRHTEGNENCLSNNFIRYLKFDKAGNLWVATKKGLNKFNIARQVFEHFFHDPDNPKSIGSDFGFSLFEDNAGILWIGLLGNGINKFNRENNDFTRYLLNSEVKKHLNNTVRSICQDETGDLWIGTYFGINKFDRKQERFIFYGLNNKISESVSEFSFHTLFRDSSGLIWCGTRNDGIYFWDPSPRFHNFYSLNGEIDLRNDYISAFSEDSAGVLWIGTARNGVVRFEDNKMIRSTPIAGFVKEINRMSHRSITDLFLDDSGILWIGTSNSGLIKCDPKQKKPIQYLKNGKENTDLSSNQIMNIVKSRSGFLWIGTSDGLNRFDIQSERFRCYRNTIEDIHSISGNIITSLFEDKSGNLWIGTESDGLNRYDPTDDRFIRYMPDPEDPNSLSYNRVSCIYESQKGKLWIGTYDGLNRYIPEKDNFQYFDIENGAINGKIFDILEDDENILWISTNFGLLKFNPFTGRCYNQYINGDRIDEEPILGTLYRTQTGNFLIGGYNRITVFSSDSIKGNQFVPPIVITHIKGQPVPGNCYRFDNEPIYLSWREPLSVEFAALNFENPQKNHFSYMIEGIDDNWNYLGHNHKIVVLELKTGRHILRIKGASPDGVWNEKGISVRLSVAPPFWSTWWFIGTVILAVIGILCFLFKKRVEHKRKKLEMELKLNCFFEKYKITAREKDVIMLLMKGKSNREIEDELYISVYTVKNHIANIFQKLKVNNRFQFINLINKYF